MASERLQGEEQFYSKNYLLEMPLSHSKMHLKSASQKLNFVMAEAVSKRFNVISRDLVLAKFRNQISLLNHLLITFEY